MTSRLAGSLLIGVDGTSTISTDGGRFDVDIDARERRAIYWEAAPESVRRCSWFYKLDGETKYVPYEEDFSEKLEVCCEDCEPDFVVPGTYLYRTTRQ